jgi:hypothetical protein
MSSFRGHYVEHAVKWGIWVQIQNLLWDRGSQATNLSLGAWLQDLRKQTDFETAVRHVTSKALCQSLHLLLLFGTPSKIHPK